MPLSPEGLSRLEAAAEEAERAWHGRDSYAQLDSNPIRWWAENHLKNAVVVRKSGDGWIVESGAKSYGLSSDAEKVGSLEDVARVIGERLGGEDSAT